MTDMHRECEHCGGAIPDHKRVDAMFCGVKCAKAAYGLLLSAGRLEDKANRPPCEGCGVAISPKRFRTARFCCKACHRRWKYRQTVEARPVKSCAACGSAFHPVRDDRGQRFCSRKCSNTVGARAGQPIDCEHCGTTVANPRRGQRYCGLRCKRAVNKATRRARG